MSEPPLELRGMGHAFGTHPVLAGVDLILHPGEFLAVLGPSGCGKTTLLRAVAGLVTPVAGMVRLAGQVAARDGHDLLPVERRRVGLVFQDYALFPALTVRENIAFGLRQADNGRVDELLHVIGMGPFADRRPHALSGGQQQRVALARALAPRPRILLLDEPFANVDAALRQSLAEELARLVRREGTSVLLVTHDRTDALGLADRVAVLVPAADGATVAQCDTPERVYARPASREVAALVGPAAFVSGAAAGDKADTAWGTIPLAQPAQGSVTVVVRPEDLRFVAMADGAVEVVARRFHGMGYRLTCRMPGGEVMAAASGMDAPAVGARGRVAAVRPCWPLPDGPA